MNIEEFTGKFSKKLTLAITSVVFIILTEKLGIDIDFEQLIAIVTIIVSYILGQSAVDFKNADY
jgi:hypothetical protein